MCVNGKLWQTQVYKATVASCILAKPLQRAGFSFQAGDLLRFTRGGKLKSARLATKRLLPRKKRLPKAKTLHYRKLQVHREGKKPPKSLHPVFRIGEFKCYFERGTLGLICGSE